jgi:hypothetical protein
VDALPPSMAGTLKDLEDRLSILERTNKLFASAIVGGTLRVLDATESPVVLLGLLPTSIFDPILTNGIRVYSAGGVGVAPIMSINQTNGMSFPWVSGEWKAPSNGQLVTSGTFATMYTSTTELISSKEILFRVRLAVDAATTGEAKVLGTGVDGSGGGQLGNTLSLSASTDDVREFRFGHGFTLGTGPLMFSLQVRRVSGAGNVTVYQPHPLHYGSVGPAAGGWV